ncbi:mitochondrial chaperone BCS1 [Microdochium nivale]|nr:mitochondrial chaperone BCS1 [Microdochium nivale]
MSARAGSGGIFNMPDHSASSRRLLETSAPGFSLFQGFFKTWLRLDLTSLALALTVFGALSSGTQQLRGVALRIYSWITQFFTASISISGTDRLNREVLNWLGAKVLTRQHTRILTAQSEAVQGDAYAYRRQSLQRIDYHHDKRVPIQYLPTFGTTWFTHEGNLFLVRRVPDPSSARPAAFAPEMPDQYAVAPSGYEPLVVMCLGRSVQPIKRFLAVCREFADKQREAFITVRASRSQHYREGWDTTILRPMRPLETVHLDKRVRDELVLDIRNYLKPSTRRFYMERGIPYRRGYLLHGPPGTGKTSLSLALAGHFGLELYLLHLPTIREDGDLERLFVSLPPQCIVLIEDIDAVGLKRQPGGSDDDDEDDDSNKDAQRLRMMRSATAGSHCTLSGLLNVLDGVASQEGRIVLMTSNFAAQLDDALIRPGRIDRMIFLGNISKESARLMYLRMYMPDRGGVGDAEARSHIGERQLSRLAHDFRDAIPDDTFTPAQVQEYLLKYRNAPVDAARDVFRWSERETAKMEEVRTREREAAERRALKKVADKEAEVMRYARAQVVAARGGVVAGDEAGARADANSVLLKEGSTEVAATPTIEAVAPVADAAVPIAQVAVPAAQVTVPAAAIAAPVQAGVPGGLVATPVAQSAVSAVQATVPAFQAAAPAAQAASPPAAVPAVDAAVLPSPATVPPSPATVPASPAVMPASPAVMPSAPPSMPASPRALPVVPENPVPVMGSSESAREPSIADAGSYMSGDEGKPATLPETQKSSFRNKPGPGSRKWSLVSSMIRSSSSTDTKSDLKNQDTKNTQK